MVLRKVRRFLFHPVGLVCLVTFCCCTYVYLILMVTTSSTGQISVTSKSLSGGSNAKNSSSGAGPGGGGQETIEAIRDRHTRLLWAEVNAIAKSTGHPTWDQMEAKILASAGPPLACLPGNEGNSSACNSRTVSQPGQKVCPSSVRGPISVTYNFSLSWSDAQARVAREGQRVLPGGAWCPPTNCRHQQSLAVIIPFRDRWRQLRNLLMVLHPMLQRQAAGCYRIFVVEQYGCGAFNKGRLNNAGFLEAMRLHNFTCVVFQDTDIVPENDRNPYMCGEARPRHLAVAVDTNRYKLPYAALVGGVIAFSSRHFFRVNGYSNLYWGWGLEDDDMELRMKIGTKLKYERPPITVARFKALPHKTQRIFRLQAARRTPLLKTALQRYAKDGLNTVEYRVMLKLAEPLFTHLLIDVGEQPLDFELTGTE